MSFQKFSWIDKAPSMDQILEGLFIMQLLKKYIMVRTLILLVF